MMERCHPAILTILLLLMVSRWQNAWAANIPPATESESPTNANSSVHVECNSDQMIVTLNTETGRFNGMIYPKGLAKTTKCLKEWVQQDAPIQYELPLRGCNTMSTELAGGMEYFNTIIVQPHLKLVTNQGKGYHIRCRYNSSANTIVDATTSNNQIESGPLHQALVSNTTPRCHMKIFSGEPENKHVAANVKIGDPLTIMVSLDKQQAYGIRVTNCLVRDGLGWGEQTLIDGRGCPLDPEIMGPFKYTSDDTSALVHFPAHKFPYTSSVYYQCNVKLCSKNSTTHGCAHTVPNCDASHRNRRQTIVSTSESNSSNEGATPATIEVYSGLYVNEANDLAKAGRDDLESGVYSEKWPEDSICIPQRTFAIAICSAGLILMLCVVAALLCLMARRRSKKSSSHPGSSIYSGPYTNTAYSHSS